MHVAGCATTMAPMPSTDTLLADADHCQVAYRTADGPAMAAVLCWSDGGGLWLIPSRHAAMVPALRRDPRCAVWIDPPQGAHTGVAIDGSARIYDMSDPLTLALHAPTISAALAAMALTHRSTLAGFVRDLPRQRGGALPQGRVAIRVRIDRARARQVPERVTGVGPVLPTAVPSGVRRAVTEVRRVTLVMQWGESLGVQPAVWSAGFRLDVGATVVPAAETPACVVAERHDDVRPSNRVGLLLRGTVDSRFRLHPTQASWWHGAEQGTAGLDAPATASGLVLPD